MDGNETSSFEDPALGQLKGFDPAQPSCKQPLAISPLLEIVCERPRRSAIMVDFDGTISWIVDDPASARPVAGARESLLRLAEKFGMVAVVSGRSVSFLLDQLGFVDEITNLVIVGSHGAERWTRARGVEVIASDGEWAGVIAGIDARAREELGDAVVVENKVLGLTFHWRQGPAMERVAVDLAERLASEHGLMLQRGHMCVELRPGSSPDKGDAVSGLISLRLRADLAESGAEPSREIESAVFVGDDIGDLAAFQALDRIAARTGLHPVKVAVGGPEVPPALLAAADMVVDAPTGVMELLGLFLDC
ncbi:MAG: trehalose-phosphatase [Acidimicrobiales bacterium]